MTKDEYVHYSDCRQASFTYRKGKSTLSQSSTAFPRHTSQSIISVAHPSRIANATASAARRFREFVNFSAYLDVRLNDDIVDILGFLSFEMVRSLCVTALEVRQRLERTAPPPPAPAPQPHSTATATCPPPLIRKSTMGNPSPMQRRPTFASDSPVKRAKPDFAASPEDMAHTPTTTTGITDHRKHPTAAHYPVSLFAPPPSARQPLLPCHVLEAFAQIQRQQASSRVGGMRNFRRGL